LEEFLNRYHVYAGNKNAPDEEKFFVLLDCLDGEARDLLSGYREVGYQPGMLKKAISILQQHYGNTRSIKHLIHGKLNAFPAVRKLDYGNCTKIVALLDDISFRISEAYLHDPRGADRFYDSLETEADLLLRILPTYEQSEYFKSLELSGGGLYGYRAVQRYISLRYKALTRQRQFERIFDQETPHRVANVTIQDITDSDQFREHGYGEAAPREATLAVSALTHQTIQRSVHPPLENISEVDSGFETAFDAYCGNHCGTSDGKVLATDAKRTFDISRSAPAGEAAPGASQEIKERPRLNCAYCDNPGHPIWTCPGFIALTVVARYEVVRSKNLCYHCLGKGHGIKECRFRPDQTCGIDGCKSKHHRLVHRPRNERTMVTIEEYIEQFAMLNDRDYEPGPQISNYTHQAFLMGGPGTDVTLSACLPMELEYCSIRQVTCDLLYNGMRKRIVVALDSCANNTNIDTNLARTLNLPVQRANVVRNISFVKGSQQFTSDYVNFQLCPTGKKGPTFAIGAYTIDDLVQGTPVVDWQDTATTYTYLKKAEPQRPESGDECVLLLGTDFSGIFSTTKELKGDYDEPIAGLGPLGWWFQGRTGRFSRPGTINYMRHQSLFAKSRASVDWEPSWKTVKRFLGDKIDMEYDAGFDIPLSKSQLLALLSSRGIGINTEETTETDSSEDSAEAAPTKTFPESKEKRLDELRSSEPTGANRLTETPEPKGQAGQKEDTEVDSDPLEKIRESFERKLHELRENNTENQDEKIAGETFDELGDQLIRDLDEKFLAENSASTSDEEKEKLQHRILEEFKKTQPDSQRRKSSSSENGRADSEPDVVMSSGNEVRFPEDLNHLPPFPEMRKSVTVKAEDFVINLAIRNCDEDEREVEEISKLVKAELLSSTPNEQEDRAENTEGPPEQVLNFLKQDQDYAEHAEQDCVTWHALQVLGTEEFDTQGHDDQLIEEHRKLEELLSRHWEMEAVGLAEKIARTSGNKEPTEDKWSAAQRAIDDKMKIVYLAEEKKFQMSIPWKDGDKPNFRCNRLPVWRRQEGHLRKLPTDRREKVDEIFRGYKEKDYVRPLEGREKEDQDSRYLPYFCVCDEAKITTPVRVVWDCRAVYYGKSLNSEIEETPNRLQDLFKILLRLRKFRFTLTADVSEMFLRVRLDPRDRRYHRFIHETQDYEWNSMLFGNAASPNASQKVFATLCEMFGEPFPNAVETLKKSFYMDDVSDSRATEEQIWELAQQLIAILDLATMPIRKFYSNSPVVLKNIEPELRAKEVSIGDDVISVEPGKILGMKYHADPEKDFLSYNGRFKNIREWVNRGSTTIVEEGGWTKRRIAQAAASIYDPHGLIAPFTVRSKIILQEIWKHPELDWDDKIPPAIADTWETWLDQVFVIQDLELPRWVQYEPRCRMQVHTFCDASEEGMCCAVFILVKKKKEIHVNLVAAKARVSPLKAESISRLELVACTMGTRLSAAVREVYTVNVEDSFFWTDSMVCLHWINMPSKAFKAYVGHRVGEVQNFTEPRQWKHVPTKMNPADVGTRKISAGDLRDSKLWWHGPEFLLEPISSWPNKSVVQIPQDPELKPSAFTTRVATRPVQNVLPGETVLKTTDIKKKKRLKRIEKRYLRKIRKDRRRFPGPDPFEEWIIRCRPPTDSSENKKSALEIQLDRLIIKKRGLEAAPSVGPRIIRDHEDKVLKTLHHKDKTVRFDPTFDPRKSTRERKKEKVSGQEAVNSRRITAVGPSGMDIIDPIRHSAGAVWNGLPRLLRITAYVLRFIRHCMTKIGYNGQINTGPLHPGETTIAKKRLIRMSQQRTFGPELEILCPQIGDHRPDLSRLSKSRRSRIQKFSPFLDHQRILRSNSRLGRVENYGYDKIYPVILDRHDPLTRLLAQEAHHEQGHPVGHNAVKARIQAEYAIVGLGSLLWTLKWQCSVCTRRNSKPLTQLQASLPEGRLGTKLRAFNDVGLDFAGPFDIVMGRGRARKKVYILVLTCLAVRAVHLEATGGMETTDVINAISRFVDMRGVPETIVSDNQTSFIKADKDLTEWIKTIDFNKIQQHTLNFRGRKGIVWNFNPPHAPHFGGIFEIIVKATKRALYKTIGQADLNEEGFRTAVSKATWMLNQRPIQKIGDNNDWEALTPSHFLGCPEEAAFPPDIPQTRLDLQGRLRHQLEVQQHFWQRFQQEIVPLLAPRSKWFQHSKNLKEGDVVIEINEQAPRGEWKLARITKIFPSTDDYVRKVEITDSAKRTYIRPISKLIPLSV